MRAIPTTSLKAIAWLSLCATPMLAEPATPLARPTAAGVVAGGTTIHERARHAAARAHATAKPADERDTLNKTRLTARSAKTAQVKTAAENAAASQALAKTAKSRAATGRVAAGVASARAQAVAADAATVQRVHAWEREQAQREAAAQAAAQAAIRAADRTMEQAIRSGEAPADPVLWTAEAVFPKDTTAPVGAVMAASPASGTGLTGDTATDESAAAHSGTRAGQTNRAPIQANAGAASSSAVTPAQAATTAVLMPSLYNSRGSLVVPAPLFGSREILLHQNEMAETEGIDRIRDDADLATLRRENKLVPLPANETVQIDERLPQNRRYARPWTANFVTAFARDFYAEFHEPVQVNSAVRTVAFQKHLERTNGNAAAATGDAASPHLTGEAVDIAKHGLTLAQIAWMRAYLQPLIEQGKIDVEEEFQQACFHISVYEKFLPAAGPRFNYAASRQGAELP